MRRSNTSIEFFWNFRQTLDEKIQTLFLSYFLNVTNSTVGTITNEIYSMRMTVIHSGLCFLLMVGPCRSEQNVLGETDGERFVAEIKDRSFVKNFKSMSITNWRLTTCA